MISISEGSSPLTEIVTFKFEPTKQNDLLACLETIIEKYISHKHGFVSAVIHKGVEAGDVFLYVQWTGREEWEAALKRDPEIQRELQKLSSIAEFSNKWFTVDAVFESKVANAYQTQAESFLFYP